MNNKISISNRHTMIFAALATLLTLVLVRFPLPFLYGIELLFFTAVSWFVYLRYSLHFAVFLTIAAAACGIFLWDLSPILALYPVEILLVGWISAKSKHSIVLWDIIYWLTFGLLGLYFTYGWLTESAGSNTVVFLLFSMANGLANVFFGGLAADYLPLWRSKFNNNKRKWRIGRISYHLCLSLLILPISIYLLSIGYFIYQNSQSEISARLDTIYTHVNDKLNQLSVKELRDLKVRSALQKASLQNMFLNLTTGTDVQLTLIDSNQKVVATLDPLLENSAEAYDWKAMGTVEKLSDSLYLWKPDHIPAYNKIHRWSKSDFISVYSFERLPYMLIAKQPAVQFQQDIFNLYLISLLLVGLSTLLSAMIAYLITKRFSKSLIELGGFSTGLPRRIRLRETLEWKNSSLYEVEVLKTNFKDMSKEIAGMFNEINQSEEKLRLLVHYDALTGLANRYSFGLYLPSLIQEARERKSRIACLFFDLDHFKSINDTYGHEVGDLVLKEVGVRLKLHNTDKVKAFRLSGDEFVVVMSEPLPNDIEQWAQEIHNALMNNKIAFQDQHIQLELSVGVALYPTHGQDAETLLRSSDHAMYEAKASGRNRVRLSSITHTEASKGGKAE